MREDSYPRARKVIPEYQPRVLLDGDHPLMRFVSSLPSCATRPGIVPAEEVLKDVSSKLNAAWRPVRRISIDSNSSRREVGT